MDSRLEVFGGCQGYGNSDDRFVTKGNTHQVEEGV